ASPAGRRTTRKFFLSRNTLSALSANAGATTTSTNRSRIASAASRSTATLNAITEPNAEVRSVARARSYASRGERPSAIPHGVVCLMIAHATASEPAQGATAPTAASTRSEEHTSELQSLAYLVCRLLLEKKKHLP